MNPKCSRRLNTVRKFATRFALDMSSLFSRIRGAVRPSVRGVRVRNGGSSSGGSHHHGDGHLSSGASAYEAQTPRLFGEAVSVLFLLLLRLFWGGCCFLGLVPAILACCSVLKRLTLPLPFLPFLIYCHTTQRLQPHHGERAREAWELPFYFTIAGVGAIFFAYMFRPSTNPHEWARDEAEERFRRCVFPARPAPRTDTHAHTHSHILTRVLSHPLTRTTCPRPPPHPPSALLGPAEPMLGCQSIEGLTTLALGF